jgi:hypothetical protein
VRIDGREVDGEYRADLHTDHIIPDLRFTSDKVPEYIKTHEQHLNTISGENRDQLTKSKSSQPEAETFEIYLENTKLGNHPFNYDFEFETARFIESPEDADLYNLKYVRDQYFQQENAEELLDALPYIEDEQYISPKIGTMHTVDLQITDLDWDLPEIQELRL